MMGTTDDEARVTPRPTLGLPTLGFWASCIPSRTGVGWEQRAFSFVQAYRQCAELDMICAPYAEPDLDSREEDLATLASLCRRFELIPPPHKTDGPPLLPPPLDPVAPTPYGSCWAPALRSRVEALATRVPLVHAMREVSWAPLREHFASRRVLLDLDEVPRWVPHSGSASRYREYLVSQCEFPSIFVSSPVERALLGNPSRVRVIQNAIRVPAQPVPPSATSNLLLVGNLGFGPNRDSIRYFATEVLPLLWREAPDVRLIVVGRGELGDLAPLFDDARLEAQRNVADLSPLYASARIAIAPLRAGAGTKIKILEAFAHGVPVVTTPVGLEGLGVTPGQHALIGNDAQQLADACALLLQYPETAQRLVAAARDYVKAHHALAHVEATIVQAVAPPLSATREVPTS